MIDALLDIAVLGLMLASVWFVLVQSRRDRRQLEARSYLRERAHWTATPRAIAAMRESLSSVNARANFDQGLAVVSGAVGGLRWRHVLWLRDRVAAGMGVSAGDLGDGEPVATSTPVRARQAPGPGTSLRGQALETDAQGNVLADELAGVIRAAVGRRDGLTGTFVVTSPRAIEDALRARAGGGDRRAKAQLARFLVGSPDQGRRDEGRRLLEECALGDGASADGRVQLATTWLDQGNEASVVKAVDLLIGDAAENASAAALLAGVLLHGERGAPPNAARALDVYLNGAGRKRDWERAVVRMLRWLGAERRAFNIASRSISRNYAAVRPPWKLRQVDGLSSWVEAK